MKNIFEKDDIDAYGLKWYEWVISVLIIVPCICGAVFLLGSLIKYPIPTLETPFKDVMNILINMGLLVLSVMSMVYSMAFLAMKGQRDVYKARVKELENKIRNNEIISGH